MRDLFTRHALEETPKSDDPAFVRSRWWTVLSNQTAVEAASTAAERAGFFVYVDNSCDDWDYERAAEYFIAASSRAQETVFARVSDLGRGSYGEGQRTAESADATSNLRWPAQRRLAAKISPCSARARTAWMGIALRREPWSMEALWIARDRRGLDARAALEKFDAYPFFSALGDAIEIGPTGNNLRDLRILLAW